MTISLYYGPYNDPLDANNTHHWDFPHAPDFHNAALTITPTQNAIHGVDLSITLAVRNTTTSIVTADFVKVYAAACGILNTAADVNQLAGTILTNMAATPLNQWFLVDVPGMQAIADVFWSPPTGPMLWTVPPYASGFIIIATLQAGTQQVQNDYVGDPSVAIWLG